MLFFLLTFSGNHRDTLRTYLYFTIQELTVGAPALPAVLYLPVKSSCMTNKSIPPGASCHWTKKALLRRISDRCCLAIQSNRHPVPILCCIVPVYKLLPSRSRFQTCWFLHLQLRAPPGDGPGTVFLPHCGGVFAHRQHTHCLHRHDICNNSEPCPQGWTSDLFSSKPMSELGGEPCGGVFWIAVILPYTATATQYPYCVVQSLYLSQPLS
jgi:hypothetical protein